MAAYQTSPTPVVVDAVVLSVPMTMETQAGSVRGSPGDFLVTNGDGSQYFVTSKQFWSMFVAKP